MRRFWREVSPARDDPAGAARVRGAAATEAAQDALLLKCLDGGHGEDCNNADDCFTLWRRRFHHGTFCGFMLCFASTGVATLYHYLLGLQAPLCAAQPAGAAGHGRRHRPGDRPGGPAVAQPAARSAAWRRGAEAHGLLPLVSLSGLASLALRDTRFMALWLATHLGTVMALFLTLPHGKFAHGIFRSAALLKYAMEKRLPDLMRSESDK